MERKDDDDAAIATAATVVAVAIAARQMESTLHLQHTFHSIHRFQRDNYVLLCSPHKNTLFFRAYQSTASTIYHLLCFLVGKNVIVSMV